MNIVDAAERLCAFAYLRRLDLTDDDGPHLADGTERCGRCRSGLNPGDPYLPVADPEWPGQHSIVCGGCARGAA